MSTLAEIQEAIVRLPEEERHALTIWLDSQSAPQMRARDEELLLRSLDQAICELNSGKGVPSQKSVSKLLHGLQDNFAPLTFVSFVFLV